MTSYDFEFIREVFGRLFVMAIQEKMNLLSFTKMLERSKYVDEIEKDTFSNSARKPVNVLFNDITGHFVEDDETFGIYNDAYWAGVNYYDLQYETKKTFSYIFLKLPLERMLSLYPTYHEMGFSNLLELFGKVEKENTILKLLCSENHVSLAQVSRDLSININTIKKYALNDDALFNASFMNIVLLSAYFKVPLGTFVKAVPSYHQ